MSTEQNPIDENFIEDAAQTDMTEEIKAAAEQVGIDIENSPENNNADNDQLALLVQENNKLVEEAATAKDQAIRAVAEAENIRKRSQKEIVDSRKFALTSFARDLIPVVENMYRAIGSIDLDEAENNSTLKSLNDGVSMTLQELTSVLEKNHIKRINPAIGEAFSTNQHQAVVQIENDDYPEGSILQVMQAGYTINERLLQPVMVGVSKLSAAAKEAQAQQPADGHVDTQA